MSNYFSNKTIEKIKYDLVRNKFISLEKLMQVEEISRQRNQNLAQTLIEEEYISEEAFLEFIQDNLHIPHVNLNDYSIDENCLSFISPEDAGKYKIFPLFRIENVLTIAMSDPLDLFVLNNLVKSLKCNIEPIICSERLILDSIEKYYSQECKENKDCADKEDLVHDWREELNEETPDMKQAEKIVNSIISQALREKAFEVILENDEEGLSVKFKKLKTIENKGIIPFLLSSLSISYLKDLCGLDISVSDVPQLGKFTCPNVIKCATGVVSTFPSTKGERIVIKLYKPPKTINELQIRENEKNIILNSLKKPGIILISGPALCGKSFLAYTLLNSIKAENKNIMTVESIVKYDLSGINQCELNEKIGFSIEKALKFIDFQSPEVIYIEEIFSGKLTNYVLTLVKSGRLVITEVNASDTEELLNIFSSKEINELKKLLNCSLMVRSLEDIEVVDNIKTS